MQDAREPTPAERLGVLVKETQSLLHQRMDDVLRPLGLSVPQYACLTALAEAPGITSSGLARRAFVSRQSMNVLLQGLERRGLIERSDTPGPRRERTTRLMPAAVALLERTRGEVAAVVDAMAAPLSPDDLDALDRLLAACRDALVPGGGDAES